MYRYADKILDKEARIASDNAAKEQGGKRVGRTRWALVLPSTNDPGITHIEAVYQLEKDGETSIQTTTIAI